MLNIVLMSLPLNGDASRFYGQNGFRHVSAVDATHEMRLYIDKNPLKVA